MVPTQTSPVAFGTLALAVVALVWAGMVIGVSGLATPVKFAAPSLTLPVALDVGRVTFQLFSRIEWGLVVALALLALATRASRGITLLTGLLAALLVLQAGWLLPALDARVSAIIAGGTPASSFHHAWFVATEAVKLVALLAIGILTIRRRDRRV